MIKTLKARRKARKDAGACPPGKYDEWYSNLHAAYLAAMPRRWQFLLCMLLDGIHLAWRGTP